jgi:hypothetical protein
MNTDPYLTKTGAVAMMAYRRPTTAYVEKNGDPRKGYQLWLMRLADDSLVLADAAFPGDNDSTWDAVKDGMRQLAADVGVQTVNLPDGSELVRDDAESM